MTQTADGTITRESARAEIEATRTAFHELLDSLSEADFKKKSGNGAWSNGQLMWHWPGASATSRTASSAAATART